MVHNGGMTAAGLPEITRVACYGLVLDEDGRLLLCRLAPGLADVGKWTLPGGGVEFGEDLESATEREVFEETGLHVNVTSVADAHSQHFSYNDRELYAVRISYWTTLLGGLLRFETDGSTDHCAFFSLDELDSLPVVPLVHRAVALIQDRLSPQ